jgi:hypothetical protein
VAWLKRADSPTLPARDIIAPEIHCWIAARQRIAVRLIYSPYEVPFK